MQKKIADWKDQAILQSLTINLPMKTMVNGNGKKVGITDGNISALSTSKGTITVKENSHDPLPPLNTNKHNKPILSSIGIILSLFILFGIGLIGYLGSLSKADEDNFSKHQVTWWFRRGAEFFIKIGSGLIMVLTKEDFRTFISRTLHDSFY